MFKSLKIRLILTFIAFSLLSLVIIIINKKYDSEKNKINNIISEINKAQIIHLNNQKIFRDFLYIDTRNSNFFLTKKSKFLQQHDSVFKITENNVNKILASSNIKLLEIDRELKDIKYGLDTFKVISNEISRYYLLKGFKDFGNTGKMRKHAHNLENIKSFSKEKILQMRRHEKDFIIRGEKKYSDLFFQKYNIYRNEIVNSRNLQKEKIVKELDLYKKAFEKLIMYSNIIGEKNNTGLFKKLNAITQKLQINFISIKTKAEKTRLSYLSKLKYIYIIILLILLTASVIIGVFLANKITKPISTLGNRMNLFIKSDFSLVENFKYKTKIPEIKKLIENYFILKKETLELVEDLNLKVEERTKDLKSKTKQVENQNIQLKNQTEKLLGINENIYAGLNYAKHIQNSLLPSETQIKKHFKDFFIIQESKDIVSGDFYWSNRFTNIEGKDLSVFVVADSTGHGVAGALMSMLGITFLNEITPRNDISHASEVLMVLRDKINATLRNEINKSSSNNGMDIGIFILDNNTLKLEFAGANNKMYIVRNQELITLNGDKMSIGGGFDNKNSYNDYDIVLEKGDNLYLFTDGYYDQFGGDKNSKFMKKNLKKLLISNYALATNKQKNILYKTHITWRGNNEQTDDILVCGFKV